MDVSFLNGLMKPVMTAQAFIHRLAEATSMSLDEADELTFDWAKSEDITLHSVSRNAKTTSFISSGCGKRRTADADNGRLLRDPDEVRRHAVPVGQIGHFKTSPEFAGAVNHIRSVAYEPNKEVLAVARKAVADGTIFDKKTDSDALLTVQEFNLCGESPYWLGGFPDNAGRIYTWSQGVASYQGGDFSRSICDYSGESEWFAADEEAIAFLELRVNSEYGVNYGNYNEIIDAAGTLDLFKTPQKYGIRKKPWCSFRAALALRECKQHGYTRYILQLDHTCSGFQFWSLQTGCNNLSILTNCQRSDEVQDFYTPVYEVARANMPATHLAVSEYESHFFSRGTSKGLTVPIGYGASKTSSSRSLIFRKDKGKDVEYLDQAGSYIPSSLESINDDQFHKLNLPIWKTIGMPRAVGMSLDLAEVYETGVYSISPRLRDGMRIIKECVRNATEKDEVFTYTNATGFTYRCENLVPDYKSKDRIKTPSCTINGKRVGGWTLLPLNKVYSEAAAPPRKIHCDDAGCVHYVANDLAGRDCPYSPIHDSHGVPVGFGRLVIKVVEKYMFEVVDVDGINKLATKHSVTSTLRPLNTSSFDGSHLLGIS